MESSALIDDIDEHGARGGGRRDGLIDLGPIGRGDGEYGAVEMVRLEPRREMLDAARRRETAPAPDAATGATDAHLRMRLEQQLDLARRDRAAADHQRAAAARSRKTGR